MNQLISKIRDEIPSIEGSDEFDVIKTQFEGTITHIRDRKESDGVVDDVSYAGVDV